jgi:hypothetical protein
MQTASRLLAPGFPSPETIEADIANEGFKVYPGAVHVEPLQEMKAFWVEYFGAARPDRRAVRSNLRLGEENFNSYSDTAQWCLFRDFDFLWNAPTHALTRELGLEIHRRRNKAQRFEEERGLKYSTDCYGIYISTSCYPGKTGRLRGHSDGHEGAPILQYMVPFTHKGIDYETGGLYVHDAKDNKVDVDAVMKPGDIVFFDGRVMHGVDTIGASGPTPGRIASFAIPTFFKTRGALPSFLRQVEDVYFDVRERVAGTFKGKGADGGY